jgi:tripartite-type tricarboxylate transporter receptor subunit TctC
MPEVRAGRLKILAVSSARRAPALPNVPTVAEETGIRTFDVGAWAGVFAPRGTPREIVARLNREIGQALAEPGLRERLAGDGAELAPMSAEQFGDFVRAEVRRHEALLQEQFCASDVRTWWGCFGPAAVP